MIHASAVLLAFALFAPQDQTPAPTVPLKVAPGAQPQNPQPQVQVQQPGQQPPQVAAGRVLTSIKEYRGSEGCPYVRRSDDVRDFDLAKVDLDAEVVASVNGKEITRDQLRMWVAFNSGFFGVQNELTRILTQTAVDKLVKDRPDDAKLFVVTDEDVAARLKSEEDQARAQGETGYKAYVDQIERTMGWERYREFVKTQLQSEKLLLPPVSPALKEGEVADPNAEISMLPPESAMLLDDQAQLRDYLVDSYLNRRELPPLFRVQFLKMLQDKMVDRATVKYAIEEPKGLGKGVFMQVEGIDIPIERILDFATADRSQWERALRLALLYGAVDDELAKNGCVISSGAFAGQFASHEAEFANTLFPLKNLIQLRGFRNMAEYRQYYMRRLGFQLYVKDVICKKDPALYEAELSRHHAQFGRLFYESGKANVDLLFASVTECEKEKPGTDGWAAAQERIVAAYDAVTNQKMAFADAKAKFSHPISTIPDGVLAQKVRNELRMALGETDYNIFVDGYSFADDVYYNRVEGEIIQPVRMKNTSLVGDRSGLGYLIGKVGEFRTSNAIKDFATQRPLVENDYIDLRYTYFAHECLKNAKIDLTVKN